jgi:hypothetical protein
MKRSSKHSLKPFRIATKFPMTYQTLWAAFRHVTQPPCAEKLKGAGLEFRAVASAYTAAAGATLA